MSAPTRRDFQDPAVPDLKPAKPLLILAIVLLVCLVLNLHPASADEPQAGRCVQPLRGSVSTLDAAAQQDFREQRYAAAYGRYARLADGGHAPSAERALFMLLNGPSLFGSDWTASMKQQACWNALLVTRARLRVALENRADGD
jgi:hypothetical protein